MRRFHILIAASVIAVGLLALPNAVPSEAKQQSQSRKLEDLLKDRQSTLQQLVEVVTVEYRDGTTGFDAVVRATDQLLDAELELAKSTEARITILEKRVEPMKSLFAMVRARFEAAQVSLAQVLEAKAALLESQIQLAREQADGGKPQE